MTIEEIKKRYPLEFRQIQHHVSLGHAVKLHLLKDGPDECSPSVLVRIEVDTTSAHSCALDQTAKEV